MTSLVSFAINIFTKPGEFLIQGWRVSTNGFRMLASFCGEFENNYTVLFFFFLITRSSSEESEESEESDSTSRLFFLVFNPYCFSIHLNSHLSVVLKSVS